MFCVSALPQRLSTLGPRLLSCLNREASAPEANSRTPRIQKPRLPQNLSVAETCFILLISCSSRGMSETPDPSALLRYITEDRVSDESSPHFRLPPLAPPPARLAMDPPKVRRAPRPRLRETLAAGLCLALAAALPSCGRGFSAGVSGLFGLVGLFGLAGRSGAPLRAVAVEESVKSSRPWKPVRPPLVPMLFETFNVSDNTDVKAIAGYISGVLEESETLRIVDMKVMTRKARSKALYILAYINAKEVRTTAQILPRQRDGRCRLRIIRDFPVTEDPEPAVLRVGSNTNATALANLIAYRLRSVETRHAVRCRKP